MPIRDREALLEYRKRYYAAHAEEQKAKAKAWNKQNPERKRARDKAYYEEHKEQILVRDKAYRDAKYRNDTAYRQRILDRSKQRKNKLKAEVDKLLGTVCVRCGFSDSRALQIDHVNGGGTKERVIGYVQMLRVIIVHPERYQILCANCNWIKRAERGEVPRGQRVQRTGKEVTYDTDR